MSEIADRHMTQGQEQTHPRVAGRSSVHSNLSGKLNYWGARPAFWIRRVHISTWEDILSCMAAGTAYFGS